MSTQQLVTIDSDILHGTPVFTGTRVPVQSLIDHVVAGDGLDDFWTASRPSRACRPRRF